MRAARPPPNVRKPNAGMRQEKETVLLMRGVSHATQNPVARPNPEVSTTNVQYSVHLNRIRSSCHHTMFSKYPET